jgi:hypothetical protein
MPLMLRSGEDGVVTVMTVVAALQEEGAVRSPGACRRPGRSLLPRILVVLAGCTLTSPRASPPTHRQASSAIESRSSRPTIQTPARR